MAEAIALLEDMRDMIRKQLQLMEEARKQAHNQQSGQAQGSAIKSWLGEIGSTVQALIPRPAQVALRAGFRFAQTVGSAARLLANGGREEGGEEGQSPGGGATRPPISASNASSIMGSLFSRGGPPQLVAQAAPQAVAESVAPEAVAALGPVGVAAAVAAAGLIALKAAVYDIPMAIYGWTKSLLESQRAAAQFAPQLASIFLGLEAREQIRERGYGQQTAASTGDLARSFANFEDALVPIRVVLTNIWNTIGAGLLDILSQMLEAIYLIPGVRRPVGDKETDFNKFQQGARDLARIEKERRQERMARDRFNGRG